MNNTFKTRSKEEEEEGEERSSSLMMPVGLLCKASHEKENNLSRTSAILELSFNIGRARGKSTAARVRIFVRRNFC